MATQRDMYLYDNRIVERNIQKNLLTRAQYNKFIKKLADATDKSVPVDEHQPLEPVVEGEE